MTKGSLNRREKKYDLLTTYLQMNGGSQVTITFTQFDEMLFPHAGLPKTARASEEWWANDRKHPEKGAYGWLNADYKVVQVNLKKEYIVFNKLIKFNAF